MSPCGWYVTKCGCGSCWDSYTPDIRDRAEDYATTLMWAATGRQFGLCEVVVQPCVRKTVLPLYQTYPVSYEGFQSGPYIEGGEWHNECLDGEDSASCSCSLKGRCSALLRGPTTTVNITAVIVDGVTLDPSAYAVVDGDTIIRLDGECWPTCTELSASGSASTAFEVQYLVGKDIPAAVQGATERLACEFARLCSGASCSLPNTVRSLTRQGVSVDIEVLATEGGTIRTGIRDVDMVIQAYNPHGRTRRPAVLSPDMPRARMVS